MSNLISIVYVSTAVDLFSETELINLLEVSRKNNEAKSITGLLLYARGNFIQLIEGPEAAIDNLYEKICRDPRHHHLTLLGRQPIAERHFPYWSMGFRNANNLSG
ncbi:MAG: BLUF domain-containing protein, partial [Chloroflexota bacterium]